MANRTAVLEANAADYRASMITAGWAFRRGDIELAHTQYSEATIYAANGVRRDNPNRRREARRYRAAFSLMWRTRLQCASTVAV